MVRLVGSRRSAGRRAGDIGGFGFGGLRLRRSCRFALRPKGQVVPHSGTILDADDLIAYFGNGDDAILRQTSVLAGQIAADIVRAGELTLGTFQIIAGILADEAGSGEGMSAAGVHIIEVEIGFAGCTADIKSQYRILFQIDLDGFGIGGLHGRPRHPSFDGLGDRCDAVLIKADGGLTGHTVRTVRNSRGQAVDRQQTVLHQRNIGRENQAAHGNRRAGLGHQQGALDIDDVVGVFRAVPVLRRQERVDIQHSVIVAGRDIPVRRGNTEISGEIVDVVHHTAGVLRVGSTGVQQAGKAAVFALDLGVQLFKLVDIDPFVHRPGQAVAARSGDEFQHTVLIGVRTVAVGVAMGDVSSRSRHHIHRRVSRVDAQRRHGRPVAAGFGSQIAALEFRCLVLIARQGENHIVDGDAAVGKAAVFQIIVQIIGALRAGGDVVVGAALIQSTDLHILIGVGHHIVFHQLIAHRDVETGSALHIKVKNRVFLQVDLAVDRHLDAHDRVVGGTGTILFQNKGKGAVSHARIAAHVALVAVDRRPVGDAGSRHQIEARNSSLAVTAAGRKTGNG